jgi:hypothetical protein
MDGEAILGGTRPERFRRTRDACIGFTVTLLRLFLLLAVRAALRRY